jgi:hypothetical protein
LITLVTSSFNFLCSLKSAKFLFIKISGFATNLIFIHRVHE